MPTAQAVEFVDYLLTVPNMLIVASTWVLLGAIRKAMPKTTEHAAYARVLPLLPLLLGEAAVWIPGAVEVEMTSASRIFLGIVLGFVAAHGNKLFRQTALGRDARTAAPTPPAGQG